MPVCFKCIFKAHDWESGTTEKDIKSVGVQAISTSMLRKVTNQIENCERKGRSTFRSTQMHLGECMQCTLEHAKIYMYSWARIVNFWQYDQATKIACNYSLHIVKRFYTLNAIVSYAYQSIDNCWQFTAGKFRLLCRKPMYSTIFILLHIAGFIKQTQIHFV